MQPAKWKYSTTTKELLAIVFALIHFHQYLWGGKKFTLFTDHKALVYMHAKPVLSPMMVNWMETLMGFHFDVIHRPGIANVLPDHLSCLFSTDQIPAYSTVDVESTDKHNIDDAQLGALNICVSDSIPMCVSYMNLDPKEAK